jgi:hypothetical protein
MTQVFEKLDGSELIAEAESALANMAEQKISDPVEFVRAATVVN